MVAARPDITFPVKFFPNRDDEDQVIRDRNSKPVCRVDSIWQSPEEEDALGEWLADVLNFAREAADMLATLEHVNGGPTALVPWLKLQKTRAKLFG